MTPSLPLWPYPKKRKRSGRCLIGNILTNRNPNRTTAVVYWCAGLLQIRAGQTRFNLLGKYDQSSETSFVSVNSDQKVTICCHAGKIRFNLWIYEYIYVPHHSKSKVCVCDVEITLFWDQLLKRRPWDGQKSEPSHLPSWFGEQVCETRATWQRDGAF